MSLIQQLKQRAAEGKPVRVGIIGAGKFGSMYLAQVPRTPGIHLLGIADLAPQRARDSLARVGWNADQYNASSFEKAYQTGKTFITDDADGMIANQQIEVIIELLAVQRQAFTMPWNAVNMAKISSWWM